MNLVHRWICASAWWRRTIADTIVPWAISELRPGGTMLEIGPGPGLTTAALAPGVDRLVSVEIDRRLAARAASAAGARHVAVICGTAAALPLRDSTVDAAVSLTMLHHVASPALQDRVFAEVARVLKPGGVFVGIDSMPTALFRAVHVGDTMVPLEPASLPARLMAAGFREPRVEVDEAAHRFRFRAHR